MSDVTALSKELAGQMDQIQSVLPPGMDVKRFLRTAVNAINTHAQADKLLAAERTSLFSACQKAAADGLLIDGREATLVAFNDNKTKKMTVSYIPMVQGLVKLARNSGDISNVVAEVVYQNDQFDYSPGVDPQPIHKPKWFENRGAPVGAYAVVTTKDNEKITRVLPADRIMAIGHGGRNADQYVPGKGAHFEEWWKKTVIKNVLKYAPKSTYLESAMGADNQLIDPAAIPVTHGQVYQLEKKLQPQLPDQKSLQVAIDIVNASTTLDELNAAYEQCQEHIPSEQLADFKQAVKARRANM